MPSDPTPAPESTPEPGADSTADGTPAPEKAPTQRLRTAPGRQVDQHSGTRSAPAKVTKHFHGASFLARFRDRGRAKAEFDALTRLAQEGVSVPRAIEFGPHDHGGWFVAMELIPHARTADEVLAEGGNLAKVLTELAQLLAALHNAGLDQGDLHGGNALIDGSGRAFGIDFHKARMRGPGGLGKGVLERDLTVLCASHRERLPKGALIRFLVIWWRGLSAELRSSLPDVKALARAVDAQAVLLRRKVCAGYEQVGSRWFRESSSVCVLEMPETPGLRDPARSQTGQLRTVFYRRELSSELATELRLACEERTQGKDDSPLWKSRQGLWFAQGTQPEVQALWGRAARLSAHNLPGPRPLLLSLGARPFVLLEFAKPTTGPDREDQFGQYPFHELSIAPSPKEFEALKAELDDRGLALGRGLPAAFWATDQGELCLSPRAELVSKKGPVQGTEAKLKRREARQQLFQLWPKCNGPIGRPVVRAGLHLAATAARFSAFQKQILSNLEVAFPGLENQSKRRRIASHVRHHMARLGSEWGRLGRGLSEGDWLESRVVLDDSVHYFDEQLARGKGVLIVTPHLGNWELLAPKLVARGCRGAVVGRRRLRDPGGALLEHMRAPWGFDTLAQDSSPREILRRLRDGQVIGILPDLEVPRLAGTRLPFLGKDALVMTAPAALARAARVPLLPATCVLDESERGGPDAKSPYRLRFAPPIERNRADDNDVATAAWIGVFENWIREAPSQWIWYHDRWRTPPSPADSVPLSTLRAAQKRSQA